MLHVCLFLQDNGKILLLMNTTQIFDELESHQVSLQAMQSSSAAGSFQDEVLKWQKQLQMIEAVMTVWLDVQRQWTELEEVRGQGCGHADKEPFWCYVMLFFWKFHTHPFPYNANNIVHLSNGFFLQGNLTRFHPLLHYVTLEWPLKSDNIYFV